MVNYTLPPANPTASLNRDFFNEWLHNPLLGSLPGVLCCPEIAYMVQ
jgi:hypothetical protein